MNHSQYFRNYLLLPVCASITLITFIGIFSLDFQVADYLYQLQGGAWVLKNSWFTQNFLHEGGRKFSVLLALLLLLVTVASYKVSALKAYRKGLWYVFTSALLSSLTVSALKAVSHRDCPWDLLRYGGFKPYIEFFASYPENLEYGQCFPAGHASAGYCWLGVYFFIKHYFYPYRNFALALPILLGLTFGIDQQLRGAHFLSHDIWTASICWIVAVLLLLAFRFESENRSLAYNGESTMP